MHGRKKLLELLVYRYPELNKKDIYAHIICGEVFVNGCIIREPGVFVDKECAITIRQDKKFVSRGGDKLEYVIDLWQIKVANLSFIDAGASTGGFTHCLLMRGADRVYSVDVGYNQLDYKLRQDKRVIVWERTNIMSLDPTKFHVSPDAAVADLSFRSIRRAAGHLLSLVRSDLLIALIKPQFEWVAPESDFRGVVSGNTRHRMIFNQLIEDLWEEGSFVSKVAESPLKGRRGNREFFFLLSTQLSVSKKEILEKLDDLLNKNVKT